MSLRLGLRYVTGLREEAGKRIEAARADAPFTSVEDVALRAELRDDELQRLAHIGAFAAFGVTRRDAMWQAAAVPERGTLFEKAVRRSGAAAPEKRLSPLPPMASVDRTLADYKGTGMTIGPQLVSYLRADLDAEGVVRAVDLPKQCNGRWVKMAGLVIVRQRPGTGKGFCFLTLEDETGIGNAVITPDMFQRHRSIIHTAPMLLVEGPLQHIDGVIHVRARAFRALTLARHPIAQTGSGYRMRVTTDGEEAILPKSHDFR